MLTKSRPSNGLRFTDSVNAYKHQKNYEKIHYVNYKTLILCILIYFFVSSWQVFGNSDNLELFQVMIFPFCHDFLLLLSIIRIAYEVENTMNHDPL